MKAEKIPRAGLSDLAKGFFREVSRTFQNVFWTLLEHFCKEK